MSESLAAGVLGITDPSNVGQSFAEAHHVLMGSPLEASTLNARFERADWTHLSESERQEFTDLRALGDMLVKKEVSLGNTLIDWPCYQEMMEAYGTKGDGTARALMIGALTPLSARSFQCLARDVYGADRAFVVDPVGGSNKARHGNFIQASGLELPIRSGSMQFVHTNRLLHMLRDPSSPTRPAKQNTLLLLSEMARVLAPGGQLFMQELLPDIDKNMKVATVEILDRLEQFDIFLTNGLRRFGFDEVRSGPSLHHEGVALFFDQARQFGKYVTGANISCLSLFARKPPLTHLALPSGKDSRQG